MGSLYKSNHVLEVSDLFSFKLGFDRPVLPDHVIADEVDRELQLHPVEMAKRKLEAACYGRYRDWEQLFVKLDTDGNGSLDPEEFRLGLRKVARIPVTLLSDFDSLRLFRAIDADSGGSIEAEEFAKFMNTDSKTTLDEDAARAELLRAATEAAANVKAISIVAETGYYSGTTIAAVAKSKLQKLDLSWNNLGRKLNTGQRDAHATSPIHPKGALVRCVTTLTEFFT